MTYVRQPGGGHDGLPMFSFVHADPPTASTVSMRIPGALSSELNRVLGSHEQPAVDETALYFPGNLRPDELIVRSASVTQADELLDALRLAVRDLRRFEASSVEALRDDARRRAGMLNTAAAALSFCLTETNFYVTLPGRG